MGKATHIPHRPLHEIDGARTSDGGIIEFPEERTGDMRRYDEVGDLVETREVGKEGTEQRMEWEEWAEIFGVTPEDYEDEEN